MTGKKRKKNMLNYISSRPPFGLPALILSNILLTNSVEEPAIVRSVKKKIQIYYLIWKKKHGHICDGVFLSSKYRQ